MRTRKSIAQELRRALLEQGTMADKLYEYELAEHIDYWHQGLLRDEEEYVFVVTENSGDVAMVLIMPNKRLYINEAARDKLKELWDAVYQSNLERLIPLMAHDLAQGIISVNGVQQVS